MINEALLQGERDCAGNEVEKSRKTLISINLIATDSKLIVGNQLVGNILHHNQSFKVEDPKTLGVSRPLAGHCR